VSEKKKEDIKKEFALTNLAVDNVTSVVILMLLIVVMGFNSYVSMPKESFPEIVIPTVYVATPYPGNSPVDMENLVTRPIEKELKSINGVKDIESTSVQDFSSIVVEFDPGITVEKALQDVKDAVDKSKSELPTDLPNDPDVLEVNFSNIPIMFVNISGDYSLEQLKKYGEYLQDEIEKLSEISEAPIRGALEREVKINADLYQMETRQVNFGDIEQAIANENVSISGGNVLVDDYRRSIRVVGEFENREQIEDIVVKNEEGDIVYLRDVAEVKVRDSFEEPESYARSYELPVVTINVVKRSGQNLLYAADQIKEIIEEAQKNRFPEDLTITITNDQSKTTRSQLANLENSIISGVILVVLVLLFFLGIRNALFVGVAIPLSMLMSFMILNAFGVTLNFMVLFSLILALGMLVDNGIVVIENIYRHLEEGKKLKDAVKQGVGEIAVPIIASTATTVVAFIPLAFWGGIIGDFMKYLPITLIITLSSSLFVALVINPALAILFMKGSKATQLEEADEDRAKKKKKNLTYAGLTLVGLGVAGYIAGAAGVLGSYTLPNLLALSGAFIFINRFVLTPGTKWFQERGLTVLENAYFRLVNFALSGKRPYAFLGGTVVLLVFSFMLLGAFAPNTLLFPENEPEFIDIFIEKPIGTDIEATNDLSKVIEKDIIQLMKPYDRAVESIITQVGEGTGEDQFGGGETTP
ncbi:MAG: efflux RND transporter permease subunit, partial [Bacteroidota bacterium]